MGAHYAESGDGLRIEVEPHETETRKQLIFYFTDVTANSGTAIVHWDEVEIPLLLRFNNNK